jgi:hypothetical protein
MPINFIPQIKAKEEVYDIGCVCDIKIKEQKEFGVRKLFLILNKNSKDF